MTRHLEAVRSYTVKNTEYQDTVPYDGTGNTEPKRPSKAKKVLKTIGIVLLILLLPFGAFIAIVFAMARRRYLAHREDFDRSGLGTVQIARALVMDPATTCATFPPVAQQPVLDTPAQAAPDCNCPAPKSEKELEADCEARAHALADATALAEQQAQQAMRDQAAADNQRAYEQGPRDLYGNRVN